MLNVILIYKWEAHCMAWCTDINTVTSDYRCFISGMWLMMLNFFPHHIDHGEY